MRAPALDQLISEAADDFGLREIVNPDRLADGRKTSFTWSRDAGSVCLAANRAYFRLAAANPNVAVIVTRIAGDLPADKAVVVCDEPEQLFYHLHNQAIHAGSPGAASRAARIDPTAEIAGSAIVADRDVDIGRGVEIHEGCVILAGSVVGAGTVIHPGCIVGAPGLFAKTIRGAKTQLAHFGGVRIGEGCTIHAGTNIARSVNFNEHTEIGDRVFIAPQVNVGHDVSVGSASEISSKVTLCGRARIGEVCWIGAAAVISNAISVGDGARVNIGAVVIRDVEPGRAVSGNFALDHAANLRAHLARVRDLS